MVVLSTDLKRPSYGLSPHTVVQVFHCENQGRGTYYNEHMNDSVHIVISPVDRISA